MNKEIRYSGFAANLPGYNCPDGEFDAVMDLWPENGAYKPVLPPQTLLQLSPGQKVVYIHKPKSGTANYILFVTEAVQGVTYYRVYWGTNASNLTMLAGQTNQSATFFKSVTAIGNTLILLTETGMMYFLWKGPSAVSPYLYLGEHLPELDISFGLQGTYEESDTASFTAATTITTQEDLNNLSEENQTKVTNAVMAAVNKFIADKATNAGKFLFPFLVRYAYRLYDGSLTMQSAPIFMQCSKGPVPTVKLDLIPLGVTVCAFKVCGMLNSLDYIVSQAQKTALENWSDIVKSVDIFISSPIWTIDQSGTIKHIYWYENSLSQFHRTGCDAVCKWTNAPVSSMQEKYAAYDVNMLPAYKNGLEGYEQIILPEKDISFAEQLKSVANFYLLSSINVGDLKTTRTAIDVSSEYLQSLVNRETLPDDWDSHDSLIPGYAFPYNQRMNFANISKNLFDGFHPQTLLPFSETGYTWTYANSAWTPTEAASKTTFRIYYHIEQDGKEIIVSNARVWSNNSAGEASHGSVGYYSRFYYYPNTNAKKVTIKESVGGRTDCQTFDMEPHPFLNGSVFAREYISISPQTNPPSLSLDKKVSFPNKIYTSEINNPFYFPVTNINTVGVGEIRGISAAAKPMSLGQFGQFPLYVFSTDGIWAMEVSASGGYSAKQPISMEIAKAGTITQLDSAVAFATDRGVLAISGNEVKCITETIDNGSDAPFLITNANLPQSATVLSADATRLASMVSFRTFLSSANTIFDCVSQRLIIFNPQYTYAYVCPLNGSGQWGMMRSSIVSAVNSYPNACAMTSDNKLVDLSFRGTNATHSQLAVTRPLKLDYPDVMKRITSVIQRGNFAKHNGSDAVQCVLYGSRDLTNWFAVWSSTDRFLRGMRGTSYKYYRLLLKCSLLDSESITGCSVEFEPDLTNQPR